MSTTTYTGFPNTWPVGLYAGITHGAVSMVLVQSPEVVMVVCDTNMEGPYAWVPWDTFEYHGKYVRIGDA